MILITFAYQPFTLVISNQQIYQPANRDFFPLIKTHTLLHNDGLESACMYCTIYGALHFLIPNLQKSLPSL